MAAITTNVNADRLREAIAVQTEVLHEEQARTAEIEARAEEAQRILELCGRERAESVQRQAAVTQAIAIFQGLLTISLGADNANQSSLPIEQDKPAVVESERPRPVARLGRQHYLMLDGIRAYAGASAHDLATISGVHIRRVKAVMAEDAERGFVEVDGLGYLLTDVGLDVLERFEAYRRSEGKPLPTLDNTMVDDVESDEDAPEQEIAA